MEPHPDRAAVAVIIPTFQRPAELLRCLQALGDQSLPPAEVIVVDDGSTDDTAEVVARFGAQAAFRVRYLHQPNSGPARARNRGIAQATAPISVLIGDDIFVSRDFLRLHLEHHRAHPALEEVAVGLTRWTEDGQTVTPFMRWLDRDGRIQFAYPQLLAGTPADWQHFYTSNLSFKSAYLQQHPFDETFPSAAMEDIELGYRLAQRHGLRMTFLPAALAGHRHPTDFTRSCRRSFAAGGAELVFADRWPERAHTPPRSLLKRVALAVLTEPRIVLPTLRHAAGLALRVFGPGSYLFFVLLLHSKAGYGRALRARLEKVQTHP